MYCSFCIPQQIISNDSLQEDFTALQNPFYFQSHPNTSLPQNKLVNKPKFSLKLKRYCGYQLQISKSQPMIHHAHTYHPQVKPIKYHVVNKNILPSKNHPGIKIYDIIPKMHTNINTKMPSRPPISFNRSLSHQLLNFDSGSKGHCESVNFFQRNLQRPIFEATKKQSMLVNSTCQNLTTAPSQVNNYEEDTEELKKLSQNSHSDGRVQPSSNIKKENMIEQHNRELLKADSVKSKLAYSYELTTNEIEEKYKNRKEPLSRSHNCHISENKGSIDLIQCKKALSVDQSSSSSQMSEVIISYRDYISKTNDSLIKDIDERSKSKNSKEAQFWSRESHN